MSLSEDLTNLGANCKLQTPVSHSVISTHSGPGIAATRTILREQIQELYSHMSALKGRKGERGRNRRNPGETCLVGGGPPHVPFWYLLRVQLFKRWRGSVSTLSQNGNTSAPLGGCQSFLPSCESGHSEGGRGLGTLGGAPARGGLEQEDTPRGTLGVRRPVGESVAGGRRMRKAISYFKMLQLRRREG